MPSSQERKPKPINEGTKLNCVALRSQPDYEVAPSTLKGKRDPTILALLISCGLRRAELVSLDVDRIQQREGRRVIPDLVGKGNRLRPDVPAESAVREP